MASVVVRKTEINDLSNIIDMIQELADFEKMSNGPQLTLNDLIREGGFDSPQHPAIFHSFIAEEVTTSSRDHPMTRKPIGYAICFFSFSTWEGKSLFLEDLYVRPQFRKQKVGKKLFQEVVQFARSTNCARLDLHVLEWNTPARDFYRNFGGVDLTETEKWNLIRFDEKPDSQRN
ncbi:thialysine N-epsilon-acetyltransferase isoform X2 [Phlebotomus papatasi]|uniref:thialysine N-epsilon-acetyltransferase isoform X2 n=1 Tax=Phlebotomus papatasi TaxID=29031 RepID=UPI0024844633|nr:thialysine N-epsilon-acetyltransferase isoform X2 [Phlebotomus papatasi]